MRSLFIDNHDYYTGGMVLPGRSFNQNAYRYGFNGKEKDDETGTQDYGMRIYNPALGKFLSVDPIAKNYPMLSTYQFASNTPICSIDLDGEEARIATYGAGVGYNPGEENQKHETTFKADADLNVEWKIANKSYAAHTGEDLVKLLKEKSKKSDDNPQGNIEFASIYSHAAEGGIILDNGQYGVQLFSHQNWGDTWIRTSLNDVFKNKEIKFSPNALVVFGGCNAGNDAYFSSVAKVITERYGIATIGAVDQTAPTKDGRKSINFVLNYKDENNKLQQVKLGNVLNKGAIEKAQKIVNDVAEKKEAMKQESTKCDEDCTN